MDTTPIGTTFSPILQLEGVTRHFRQGAREIVVLSGVDAVLWPGQAVALVGPSGAGKSTLLHITGLLESPSSGRISLNGHDCATRARSARGRERRSVVWGECVFQYVDLAVSALAKKVLPQLILGRPRKAAEARARNLLGSLGLTDRVDHRPAELSGGEQQRTAICRGLANSPKLLLADEPTGNLDPHTSEYVFRELVDLIRRQGVAALIATHNIELARRMDRVLLVQDGKLVELAPASIGR
jgi:lipoprotein-releasing system ATP-binding protein